MTWLCDFWRSSIGGKVTMAVTGLLLFGFVVAHLLGNLQLLKGPEAINSYAKMLHDLGPLLWVARLGLLAIFVLHVVTAIRLSRANKAARPVPYAVVVVELEEGLRLVSGLRGIAPEELELGLPLQVEFVPVSDAIALHCFRRA